MCIPLSLRIFNTRNVIVRLVFLLNKLGGTGCLCIPVTHFELSLKIRMVKTKTVDARLINFIMI